MHIQGPFNNKQFNTHIQFQWCIISNTQPTEGGAGAWAESPPPLCLPQGPGRAQDMLCLCVAGSRNSAQAKLSNYFYFLNACMRVCSCPFIWCWGQTSTLGILLYGVHCIFWGTLFHWTWNSLFQVTDWPASPQNLPLSATPQCWGNRCVPLNLLLHVYRGSEPRSSRLYTIHLMESSPPGP